MTGGSRCVLQPFALPAEVSTIKTTFWLTSLYLRLCFRAEAELTRASLAPWFISPHYDSTKFLRGFSRRSQAASRRSSCRGKPVAKEQRGQAMNKLVILNCDAEQAVPADPNRTISGVRL
jgi:hypothetical protein